MHNALFVVTVPRGTGDWAYFLEQAKLDTWKDKSALRIAENVWLLNTRESLEPLSLLGAAARNCSFECGLLPIDAPWLPDTFSPKAMGDQNAGS
jgi:hypothetical protein